MNVEIPYYLVQWGKLLYHDISVAFLISEHIVDVILVQDLNESVEDDLAK